MNATHYFIHNPSAQSLWCHVLRHDNTHVWLSYDDGIGNIRKSKQQFYENYRAFQVSAAEIARSKPFTLLDIHGEPV